MIPFDIPEKFIHLVESGQVVRKGALLVRVIDGIIVGHLKEVGGFNLFLPKQVPITSNPYFAGAQITSSIAQNFQLHSIQNLLATLQTTMMVGAGLSAVNLGITVAGFAIVINKLNKMDSKLDYTISQNKEIISRLKSIQEGYEFMNLAKLETAFQLIIDAERLEWSSENRRKKLHDAYMRLNDYSGYYYNFLKTKAIFEEHTMDLPSILEIYIRFFAILSGKLNIYYLQNDLINYKHAIESELERISSLPTFNKTNAFRAQHDKFLLNNKYPNAYNTSMDFIKEHIFAFDGMFQESVNRLDSLKYEANFLEEKNISPEEYSKYLTEFKEPDLFFISTSKESNILGKKNKFKKFKDFFKL